MRSAEVGSPIVASTPAPSTTNVSGSSLLPNIFLCELVAIEVLDALGSIGQYQDIAAADVECAMNKDEREVNAYERLLVCPIFYLSLPTNSESN